MGKEIERKFLVVGDDWRQGEGIVYRQGYLNTDKHRTVRVRVVGRQGYLTIKGITEGATRREYEYSIPVQDATDMLDGLCEGPIIEKQRYRVPLGTLVWEIDEFFGDNRGLVVAEVELESEDQAIDKPAWLGKEVTEDPRYYNANLVQHPYCKW
jgi:CYTH domain-containing protein